MLECSIGKIENAVVRRALSGYTFIELNVPVDSYSDTPTFTVAVDGVTETYRQVGGEVYMHPGEKTVVHVSGILDKQYKWLEANPMSVESMDTADILKGLGLTNGPKMSITFINLFLNNGQLAIFLANTSAKQAFVDFEKESVVYYSELYKQKPIQCHVPFRRMIGRPPIAGYVGWDSTVSGSYPDDSQVILPFGQYTNMDSSVMANVAANCNSIAELFSDMQIFTFSESIALGSTVLSPLTYDKKVIVATEEQWDAMDNVVSVNYCV